MIEELGKEGFAEYTKSKWPRCDCRVEAVVWIAGRYVRPSGLEILEVVSIL